MKVISLLEQERQRVSAEINRLKSRTMDAVAAAYLQAAYVLVNNPLTAIDDALTEGRILYPDFGGPYLYIFDDGFVQSPTPPDDDDLASIGDGYLEIIRFSNGDLQTCNADGGWTSVDRREEAFGIPRDGKT